MDDLFAPPGEEWQRVSPKLRDLHRLLVIVLGTSCSLATALIGYLLLGWWVALLVVVLGAAAVAFGWRLATRSWLSWGYAERVDDLYVTHGVAFRSLVVVPYGRMQYVDVTAGPLERMYGIATVELHTATPATDARVAGLPPAEAARLRDRLTELGESSAAGL